MGTANIAFGWAGANFRRDNPPIFCQAAAGENLTTNASTATTSNVAAPSDNAAQTGGREIVVRIVLSEEGYVRVGAAAVVGTGLRCLADTEYYFSVNSGQTVSIIDTA